MKEIKKTSLKYVIIWITYLCMFYGASVGTTFANMNRIRPQAFSGRLSISQEPQLHETAILTLQLESLIDSSVDATIRFVIPRGVVLIDTDGSQRTEPEFIQNIHIPARAATQSTIAIMVTHPGSYTLQASIYTLPHHRIIQHFFTYLFISQTQSRLSDTPFFVSRRINSTGNKEETSYRTSRYRVSSYTHSREFPPRAPRRAAVEMVNVTGMATYFDDNESRELPIRGLKVTLLDRNTKDGVVHGEQDEEIDWTYTNSQGEYRFNNIKNIDGEDNSYRDLYLVFVFENEVLNIMTRDEEIYEFNSDTLFDVPNGDVEFNLSLDVQDNLRGLGSIYNTVQLAHDFLMNKVGFERNVIAIRWPHFALYSSYVIEESIIVTSSGKIIDSVTEEYINLITKDAWKKIGIFHEYGHAVMSAAYEYNLDTIPAGTYAGPHALHTVSDPEFAMSEGWAEFMEAAVDDNALNVTGYSNSDIPNIESNKWWTGDIEGRGNNTKGGKVEGAVASILWDITDTALSLDLTPGEDDDGISDMFPQLWEIITSDYPRDIKEFAAQWKERRFDNYDALEIIYATHGVLLRPNTLPTITITSPPKEGAVADTTYTINWTASDPDSETYTVDLFFDSDKTNGGETLIQTSLLMNVTNFEWDTRNIKESNYYILAKIKDIRTANSEDYSDGPVTVDHSPLLPPVVTSKTHPDPNRWYDNNSPEFTFTTSPENTPRRRYSYVLNSRASTISDTTPESNISNNTLTFNMLSEGTWWLHIRAQDEWGYWTDTTHFRFNIGMSKPSMIWDVNQDNIVDIADLVLVSSHFGEATTKEKNFDVNGDGVIDISDLVLVGKHFGLKG